MAGRIRRDRKGYLNDRKDTKASLISAIDTRAISLVHRSTQKERSVKTYTLTRHFVSYK